MFLLSVYLFAFALAYSSWILITLCTLVRAVGNICISCDMFGNTTIFCFFLIAVGKVPVERLLTDHVFIVTAYCHLHNLAKSSNLSPACVKGHRVAMALRHGFDCAQYPVRDGSLSIIHIIITLLRSVPSASDFKQSYQSLESCEKKL